jgi:tape measure domain-containing protein
MSSGLSIKITASTAQAASSLKTLADGSEELAAKIEKANKKLEKANVKDFIENQSLTTAALQATRGEMGALDSSITSYQRKIERLIKDSLAPEGEAVKSLQGELAKLQSRRAELQARADAEAAAERRVAEAAKAVKEALKQEADIAVKSLDAKTKLEKANIRLASQQDALKDRIRVLVESGVKPEAGEIKKLEAEYRKLTKEIEENTKARQAQDAAVKGALAALAAIGAAVGAAGAFAIKSAAKVEDMTAAFEPMLGSANKARELVKRLNQEAVTTPYEIEAINAAVRSLIPVFQGNTDKAVKAFRMIGDTAGGNAQKLETLTNAYTKVMLKGKTSMMELNMIAGAGVPIFTELAASMGVSVEELTKLSGQGGISADHLTAAFERMTGAGGIFYEGMEKAAFTFNSQMLGLQENIGLAAAAVGEKLLPAAGELVGKAADAVAEFIAWAEEGDNLSNLLRRLGTITVGTSAALAAFVAVAKGHAIVKAMGGAVNFLTGALTGPAGIAALAVGGLAAAVASYVSGQEKANREAQAFAKNLASAIPQADALLTAYDKLNPGKALDKQLTEELISLYPELRNELSQYGLTVSGAQQKIKAFNDERVQEILAAQTQKLQLLMHTWELYQGELAKARNEEARLKQKDAGMPYGGLAPNHTRTVVEPAIERTREAEARYRAALEEANDLAKSYGFQIESNLSLTKLPVPQFDQAEVESAVKTAVQTTTAAAEKESEIEKIIRKAREAVDEYGKSEAESTVEKLKLMSATDDQIARYSALARLLQELKDAEEERNQIKKDTADMEKQTGDYLRRLEELHIKNDEIKNDEAQLLELERARAAAEIERSQAADKAKEEALRALNEYYDAAVKVSNADFDKKETGAAEKDGIAAFKKNLEEKLEAERGNIKGRIAVLQNGLQEIETIEGITAEQIAALHKELTKQIEEETAKQKRARIDTTLQTLSAIQELNSVFGDIAQQAADEKAEREKARLEAEKASKSRALIEEFDAQIKAEENTDEEKQRIKKQFLAEYKKNEEDYTASVEREEEKRKEAAKQAAIADKALSSAMAGINSFVAFTGALAAFAELGPLAYVQAGAILAAGLAQQAKIIATPITAETGGRFMVPDTGGRVDGAYMRVNADEVVDVTPRGESASPYVVHNVLMIERRVIYDVVNEGFDSGDIRRPWENL